MKSNAAYRLDTVRGIVILECILYALLLLALFVPVRLRLRFHAALRSGRGAAHVRWLIFGVRLPLRVTALGPPPLTLALLRRDGSARFKIRLAKRRKEPGPWGLAVRNALRVKRLAVGWVVGIKDDPAVAALLAGALGALTEEALMVLGESMPLEGGAASVSIGADDRLDSLTLRFEGIARLRAVDIMERRWRMFVDARQGSPRRAAVRG